VKKLIALALVAAFLVGTLGCSGTPTTGKKDSTGSGDTKSTKT